MEPAKLALLWRCCAILVEPIRGHGLASKKCERMHLDAAETVAGLALAENPVAV